MLGKDTRNATGAWYLASLAVREFCPEEGRNVICFKTFETSENGGFFADEVQVKCIQLLVVSELDLNRLRVRGSSSSRTTAATGSQR